MRRNPLLERVNLRAPYLLRELIIGYNGSLVAFYRIVIVLSRVSEISTCFEVRHEQVHSVPTGFFQIAQCSAWIGCKILLASIPQLARIEQIAWMMNDITDHRTFCTFKGIN